MSRDGSEPKHRAAPFLILLLVVAGAILRFYRLGEWGFDSDEVFMLRDSLDPKITNPRPLLYFLNKYLVQPFLPLDEYGLRLLPAVFGVLAIPVFYLVSRRLIGSRAALFGALLITFSPLLVYYSQFGRYWSLVFLLCCVYPYAIYLGIRDTNRRLFALGVVTGVFAVLAHPASVLLCAGLIVWLLGTYVTRARLSWLLHQRSFQWGALLTLALAIVVVVRFIPMLRGWIYGHEAKPGDTAFLLHIPGQPGVKQIGFIFGFVESLTLPLVLAGFLGIYILWQGRNRSLAWLLIGMFVLPLSFILLLSFRTPVSTFYFLPTVPILFMGAGFFLDRLARLEWELRPRWLLPATLVASIIAAGAPTLVSQYRDGRRWDFRGAARWLQSRLEPGDSVFSDQSQVLAFYLTGTKVERLRGDSVPLTRALQAVSQPATTGRVWIVAPAPSHAFRTNPKLGSLNRWMYDNCQLRNTIGVGRVDFRQQYLQIYRCPPGVQGDGNPTTRTPIAPAADHSALRAGRE